MVARGASRIRALGAKNIVIFFCFFLLSLRNRTSIRILMIYRRTFGRPKFRISLQTSCIRDKILDRAITFISERFGNTKEFTEVLLTLNENNNGNLLTACKVNTVN